MSVLPERGWFLLNQETFEVMEGQFPPDGPVRTAWKMSFAQHTALGRWYPVATQFLRRETDTLSFPARLRTYSAAHSITDALLTLEGWTYPNIDTGRPYLFTFWLGNGELTREDCLLEEVSDIEYDVPTALGALREVRFTINLRHAPPFDMAAKVVETRYHRVRQGDYYEMLAQREYGNPMLGVVIRQRHPRIHIPKPADTIKLPSLVAIQAIKPAPASEALRTAFGKKDTPQKTRRQAMFAVRNVDARSAVIPVGLATA